MSHVDWEQELDGIEADLDRIADALARGHDLPESAWAAPEGLGELPIELAERARDLLRRLADTALSAQARMSELDEELDGLSTRRRAAVAYREHEQP